jgi:NMD protein affecting ribosome stability and mRNA decay
MPDSKIYMKCPFCGYSKDESEMRYCQRCGKECCSECVTEDEDEAIICLDCAKTKR